MRSLGVTALLALALAVPAAPAAIPVLLLVDRHPFVAHGEHFRAGERVRVVLSSEQRTVIRRVAASSAGAFTANFGEVPVSRCEAVLVVAVGAHGTTAYAKLPLPPACLVARSG